MNLIARFLLSIFILSSLMLNASMKRVEIDAVNLNFNSLNIQNTIFVIRHDLNFNGAKVQIGRNSMLQFEGGTISNAKLVSGGGEILSSKYKIFNNCSLSGSFSNSAIPAEWFGAVGDGITDDSKAINLALQNSNGTMVELANKDYYIASTILMNRNLLKLKIQGRLLVAEDIVGIKISAHNQTLDLGEVCNVSGINGRRGGFTGTAILFSDNSYHSEINVRDIKCFDKGLAFIPRVGTGSKIDYAGVQYCKIAFQSIEANYCIFFDLLSNVGRRDRMLWINENQFFGGRLIGKYGIYTASNPNGRIKPLMMNGNVFYSIGFEEIDYPIKLWRNEFSTFHDLRMSESIHSKIFVDLNDCTDLEFDIKSIIPYNYIAVENCRNIDFSRKFSDLGYGNNGNFNKLYVSDNATKKIISTDLVSKNTFKEIYFDINIRPKRVLNFDELFCSTGDSQKILSNICKITLYDRTRLTVDFKYSMYKLHPEMLVVCLVSRGSIINFVNGNRNIGSITESGTYKITYDINNKIYIIKL